MPAVNPFIDPGYNVEAYDGSPVNFTAGLPTLNQAVRPGAAAAGIGGRIEGFTGNPLGALGVPNSSNTQNAAGTSENIAMHVAIIIALALVGVYAFRASGFRFVAAAGVGR